MIITGIAHPPARIHEKTQIPSIDLGHFGYLALKQYRVERLVTSLAPGWEQALARAARESEIPYTVAIPYSGHESGWEKKARLVFEELIEQAAAVVTISGGSHPDARLKCYRWQVNQADLVLSLWDYDFSSEVFGMIAYALRGGKQVANLWEDWNIVYNLRRRQARQLTPRRSGAQVFEVKKVGSPKAG